MSATQPRRVALVTGGGQGIGRAICTSLAADGCDVVVADLSRDTASQTLELVKQAGGRAVAIEVDVSQEGSVLELYRQAELQLGSPEVVVNNAGICELTPILELEVAAWDRMMAVNLRGTFLVSREAFRHMQGRRAGKIISIASAAAKIGGAVAGAHYSASKAGVVCFTKSLALQAAPFHINVNAVAPAPIETAMTDSWGSERNASFATSIPWGEYGQPQDVADAVVFLASNRARYITGEILDVNGGFIMD